MKITAQEMEQLAFMSRLELTGEDAAHYMEDLNAVLECLEVLNEPDTGNVEAARHVLPVKNVFREDEPRPSLEKKLVMANAPEEKEGSFHVPRIV